MANRSRARHPQARDRLHRNAQKATSGLYAPMAGRIVRFNAELLNDRPRSTWMAYGKGWLFELNARSRERLRPSNHEFLNEAGRRRSDSSRGS